MNQQEDDYKIPRGVEQCSLHENLNKEIGVIKNLAVKLNKKVDLATVAFLCLTGFVCIDTVFIVWGFVSKAAGIAFR